MEVVVAGVGDEGEVALAQRQPRAGLDERHGSEREGVLESAVRFRRTAERAHRIKIVRCSQAPNIQGECDGDRNAAGHSLVDLDRLRGSMSSFPVSRSKPPSNW